MAGVHIVLDSAAPLALSAAQDYSLTVVPYDVMLGSRQWHGGTDDASEIMDALAASKEPLSMRPASVEDYAEAFQRILDWGVEVVSLHPPEVELDSVAVARHALGKLDEPDRVALIHSEWTGPALSLLGLAAAQAGANDLELPDTLTVVEAATSSMRMERLIVDSEAVARLAADQEQPPGGVLLLSSATGQSDQQKALPDVGAGLRAMAQRIESNAPPADWDWHLAGVSAGADAEVAALATFLDSRRPAVENWFASADPLSLARYGVGSFAIAHYGEGPPR